MDVFFDTEFADNKDIGSNGLISIGCVALDGREFYAELTDTWHPFNCSDFVHENVLPLLNGGTCRMTESELAANLKGWVESLGSAEVIFRCDAPYFDWPWIEYLFTFNGCWPSNMRRKYGAIGFDTEEQEQRFDAALVEFWKENLAQRHHALVDARSLYFAWKYAVPNDGGTNEHGSISRASA